MFGWIASKLKGLRLRLGEIASALVLVCFIVLAMGLSGCAKQVVYKEVLIPTKCDVKKRDKPSKGGSSTYFLRDLLIYTEGLERDLEYCRGEK